MSGGAGTSLGPGLGPGLSVSQLRLRHLTYGRAGQRARTRMIDDLFETRRAPMKMNMPYEVLIRIIERGTAQYANRRCGAPSYQLAAREHSPRTEPKPLVTCCKGASPAHHVSGAGRPSSDASTAE
jgi:hypothetical protein